MSTTVSKYTFELWNSNGTQLADLTGLADNRRIVQSRNEGDQISWTIDLNVFEKYCRDTFQDPRNLLMVNSMEARVRRGDSYLAGGQIAYVRPMLSASGNSIEVRTVGFLDLFNKRFTDANRSFVDTEGGQIAATLITETQAKPRGDFGVTIGDIATTGLHSKTYDRANIKTAIQDLTKLQSSSFDVEITPEKVFKVYTSIGSDRPDIEFEWPDNIISVEVPNDGTGTANEVTAIGAGFGTNTQTIVTAESIPSQEAVKLQQKIIASNGTDNSDNGVTEAANTELAAWAFPFELPTLTVDGNLSPLVTSYGIGDRIKVILNDHAMLSHVNGLYRLEKREITIDANDNEVVKLYVSI